MLPSYNETCTHYTSTSGNTQVYIYRRKKRLSERKKALLQQKLLGLATVGISALELLAGYIGLIDEGGAFIFLLPIGIYALFTNEKMI